MLIKTHSPGSQKEKNLIFHKVYSPYPGCQCPGYGGKIYFFFQRLYTFAKLQEP